jgi:hypothetical protein
MERTSRLIVARHSSSQPHGAATAAARRSPAVAADLPGARSEPVLKAVRAFHQLAAPLRLRVVRDSEGWPTIPGKRGRVEWFDGRMLALHSTHPRLFTRVWALPGIRRWQLGDREVRALFPLEALPLVALLIRARRRRRPESASHLQKLGGPPYKAA